MRYAVCPCFIHDPLLFKDCCDHIHSIFLRLRQTDPFPYKLNQVADISANVLQLLANRLPDHSCAPLLSFYQVQIILSRFLTVGPGLFAPGLFADLIDDLLYGRMGQFVRKMLREEAAEAG